MQDVPRYQRHVIPSVSSHLTQTSQMIDTVSPASSQQATPASMQPDPIKQHTPTVDHQHHSMYHHGVMSNPRQMAPVPAMAQQMPVGSAVEISSVQRTSQQHSSLQHGLEQRQQPASTVDQASLPGFRRDLGKRDGDFSSTPMTDIDTHTARGSRKSPTALHRDSGSRYSNSGEGDMYMNPLYRHGGSNTGAPQHGGGKESRGYDTDTIAGSMRNLASGGAASVHRAPDAMLSAPSESPIQTSQLMNRQQREVGIAVGAQSNSHRPTSGELRSHQFSQRTEYANEVRGRSNIDAFVSSTPAVDMGGAGTHVESQAKFGEEQQLAKNRSPHSNRNDAALSAKPSQVGSASPKRFSSVPRERSMEDSPVRRAHSVANARNSTGTKRIQVDERKWQQSSGEAPKHAASLAVNDGTGEAKDTNTWGTQGTSSPGTENYPANNEGEQKLYRPVLPYSNAKISAAAKMKSGTIAPTRGSQLPHSNPQTSVERPPPPHFTTNRMEVESVDHPTETDGKHLEGVQRTAEGSELLRQATEAVTDSKKKVSPQEGVTPNRQGIGRPAPADENNSSQRKPLKVEDALAYLEKVKSQFSDQLSVYNQFLDIMKEFKADCIDTYEVIRRVSTLFGGHKDLILGFNTFLPPGYKIRVFENAKGVLNTGFQGPAGVFKVLPPQRKAAQPKVTGTRQGGKKKGNAVSGSQEKSSRLLASIPDGQAGPSGSSTGTDQMEKDDNIAPSAAAGRAVPNAGGAKPTSVKRQHGLDGSVMQSSRLLQQSTGKVRGTEARAHEFERAIGFVTSIKERFVDSPDTFNEFLETLRRFREEQKSIREVFETVADLFGPNKDLLSQFREFIPTIAFSGLPDAKIGRDRSVSQAMRRGNGSKVISESTPSRRAMALNGKMKPRQRAREMQFFEELKAQLGSNKGHLYTEFIKCLSLFSQGIVSKDELLHLTGEILQDDQEAHNSFLEYLDALANTNDGVFDGDHNFSSSVSSDGETTAVDAARMAYYTSKPTSEIAAEAGIEHLYSYRRMPLDFPPGEYSGRSLQEKRTLNDNWINVTTGSEDYSFKFMRRNQNEDNLFRCEDDRYELDLVIETNASTIMKLETIVATMSKLPLSEKKQHALARGALTPIHFNAIRRIYGDSGAEVVSQLKMNPAVAVPVILKRLKEKDVTWRRARMEMNKVWREVGERNYHRSLDHRSGHFKAVDKKVLSTKSLLLDIMDPVASVAGRDAEMTRARGYAVENGGGGANHRSQALKAVLAAAQYGSGKGTRKLELKFGKVQVHHMVNKLICGVAEDATLKKSIAQFGEVIQSFFGVGFTEDQVRAKNSLSERDDVSILYGDDAVYIVFRLYHLLFERVELAFDLAKEQIADRERRAKLNEEGSKRLAARKKSSGNTEMVSWQLSRTSDNIDSEGKFTIGPTSETLEEICEEFLDAAKQFAQAKLDWSRFEDKCRILLGVDCYALFTIDKTVQKLLKGIENMFGSDSSTKGFCSLFHRCQNKLQDATVNGGLLDTEGIEVLYSVAASRYLAKIRGSGANLMRFQSSAHNKGGGAILIHVIGQTCDEDVAKAKDCEIAILDGFLGFCGSYDDCNPHKIKADGNSDEGMEDIAAVSHHRRTGRENSAKENRRSEDGKDGKQRRCEKVDFLRYKSKDSEILGENLRRGKLVIQNNLEWQLNNEGVMCFLSGTCDFLMNFGRKRQWDERLKAEDVNLACSRRKKMRQVLKLDEDSDEKVSAEIVAKDSSGMPGDSEMTSEDVQGAQENVAETKNGSETDVKEEKKGDVDMKDATDDDENRDEASGTGSAKGMPSLEEARHEVAQAEVVAPPAAEKEMEGRIEGRDV